MDLFRKRKSLSDNLEYDRHENKVKARKIDSIYKVGACILGLLWVISLFKPLDLKFNIKDLKNIKYMFYEKRGNTLGNDMNHGLAVKYNDYTYYVNLEDDNKIYRVKKDSSIREKVSNDSAHDLSIVGNELFYINDCDDSKIYKFNLKNKDKKKIIDQAAIQMQISGKFVYYEKNFSKSDMLGQNPDGGVLIDPNNEASKIFKAKFDGSDNKKVIDDRCGSFAVYNGWIYYSNQAKGGLLYRITKDGTNNTKLSKDATWNFWMDDKYIYYVNTPGRDGVSGLTRIKHDGSEEVEVSNKYILSMNIVGDSIYFSSEMGLCKMNRDGKDIKAVVPNSNLAYQLINVVNDYVYYGGIYDGLARIKTNGKDMENEPEMPKEIFVKGIKGEVDNYYGKTLSMFNNREIYKNKEYIYYAEQGILNRLNTRTGEKKPIISNGFGAAMDIFGEYIFYINYNDFSKMYVMKEDGTDNKLFFNEKVDDFKISGDYIYYKKTKDRGRGIYRIKLDGSENTKILGDSNEYINTVTILKDCIYYDKNGWLYKADLDGKNEVRVLDGGSDRFILAGDYIYYSYFTGEGMYSVNLKTKDIKKIFDKICTIIQVEGDYIYAVNSNGGGLFRIKTDGSSSVKISDDPIYSALPVGKYVYYTSGGGGSLCRFNTENGEIFDVSQSTLK